ncbi:hypothetical protein [Paracoccus luteus]|uniref:hypothetical protein n=1 Tax=Paracoccus luteus TaxID=2508543 RepID=UPI00106F3CF2|nr:hypothetical protein [Paracoccus luteus]
MSHLTIAASEKSFEQLFKLVRDGFTFAKSDGGSFGPFSASYTIALHLEKGTIQLNNDGTVQIKALDVVWDTLLLKVCFDFPGFTIPGFCIIPDPWNGCLVGIPDIHIGGPICIPLNLSELVSEISEIRARLDARYFVDPGRLPAWSDLEAEFAGKPNKWRIFIDPDFVSVDPIDIPATVGNLFENLVEQAIEDLLPGWLPGFAKDILMAFLAPVVEIVKGVMDIFDSVEDFIQDLLGNQLDLLGIIETIVADHFANKYPIYQFEDPYPILTDGPLIPVKIPLRNLKADVTSQEMIVTGDIG